MKHSLRILITSAVGLFILMNSAGAQRNLHTGQEVRSLAELTVLKRKAESGDRNAMLRLGQTLASRSRSADALIWYRKAADQGSVEAASLAGDMLIFGKTAGEDAQQVAAKPQEGLALVYRAATNRHALACRTMSVAFQRGLGVRTNLVEAYAWLRFYAEADPVRRKRELDALGLALTVLQLDQADKLVHDFKRGKWPALEIHYDYKKDSRFKLSGVTIGGRLPLAIINRRTIAEGESASFAVEGGTVNVKCLKINEDSVLVAVDQESEPRLISLY